MAPNLKIKTAQMPHFGRFITVIFALTSLCLAGCKDVDIEDTASVCDKINQHMYFTEALGEGGVGPDGVWLNHWSIRFNDGLMTMSQSDVYMSGTYTCADGDVFLESQDVPSQTLKFSDGLKVLHFNPFSGLDSFVGEDRTYIQAPKGLNFEGEACKQVEGKRYVDELAVSASNSDSAVQDIIVQQPLSFEFASNGQVVEVFNGAAYSGVYDCDLDALHIHQAESDRAPMIVEVLDSGASLRVDVGGAVVNLVSASPGPIPVCTLEYAPVCAAKSTGVQCITTPCPTEVYHTYSNQCHAGVESSKVLFTGECGVREGQPVEDTAVTCTEEYAPVCGVMPSIKPCTIMPCPSSYWTEFGNDCSARAVGATHIASGVCGSKEGQIVVDLPDSACDANYDPVCAKSRVLDDCLGPCVTHEYSTFSNTCVAATSFAEIAFNEECGDLSGVSAYSQPLVKVSGAAFPKTDKTLVISNASIDGDIVRLSVGYSGCDEQHFDLHISSSFMESFPVQASYALVPQVEDECLAVFETTFEYDLIPLKTSYQKAYQTKTGSISLGELGLYEF